MKIKFFTSILTLVATSFVFYPQVAYGQDRPELTAERGTARAQKLTGIESRSSTNWNFAVGEGSEARQSNYQIEQTNSFFDNFEKIEQLNNNFEDPRDSRSEAKLFKF